MNRAVLLLSSLALATACSSGGDGPSSSSRSAITGARPLPPDFRLGAAIAGFQAEMGCPTIAPAQCEDRHSDWYQWITTPRIVKNPLLHMSGDPPASGPGFFELYEDDARRAGDELHGDSLRTSIEWSRIFPRPTFGIDGYAPLRAAADPAALDYYHRVFAALRAHGLEPLVTINHYTLPTWIHDGAGCNADFSDCRARGWAAPDVIVPEIAKYAGFVAREFGGEVDSWATLNEPFSAVVLPSYFLPSATRSNPPGLYLRGDLAKIATTAMITAHARMYDAIKANDVVDADHDGRAAWVGLVYAVSQIDPLTNDARDAVAAEHARYLFNDVFLNAVARGELDEEWNGVTVARPDLAGRLDYLGVNYYFRLQVQSLGFAIPGTGLVSPYLDFNVFNVKSDGRYPQGIYSVLRDLTRFGLPLVVTETGIDQGASASPDDGPWWYVNTLSWVLKARAEGVDVRGFYGWTLTDNYEWNHGMALKFGLYAVDPADPTKARVRRPSGDVLARIGATRSVPADLAQKYGAP